MTHDKVLEVVKKHLKTNTTVTDSMIDPSKSMLDMGASSLDVVEVVSASMRELGVKIPRTQLATLKSMNDLVDVLVKTANNVH